MPGIQSTVEEAFTERGKKKPKTKHVLVLRKAEGLEDMPGMRLCHK